MVAVNRIADWTDIQDLSAMVRNRSSPGWLMLKLKSPRSITLMILPRTVKITGRAASKKGSAMADLFRTKTIPRWDRLAQDRDKERSRIKTGQAPTGVIAVVRIKKSTSTSLTRGSRLCTGLWMA